jgi:hypothetical protein
MPRFSLKDVKTATLEHRWNPDKDDVSEDVIRAMQGLDVEKGGIDALAKIIDLGAVEKAVAPAREDAPRSKQSSGGANDATAKPKAKDDGKAPAPDGEADDSGPEDAIKPLIIEVYKAWAGTTRGQTLPEGAPAWVQAQQGENAAKFALRAAGELAKMPEAREAMVSVGHGPDWDDWVAAVMRYDGAKALADKPAPGAVEKALLDTSPLAALAQLVEEHGA